MTWRICSLEIAAGEVTSISPVDDAHEGDCRRYIVESDDLLSAFLELKATLP
jgi:hypothetical protein